MPETTVQATIAFIGGGNMARAMIGGLVAAGHPANRITVSEPDAAGREALAADWPGLRLASDNSAAAAGADLCVLAVKPDVLPGVARALAGVYPAPLYVSVAAGVRAADLSRWLGGARVVRAMPNQGALVGRSATGLCASDTLGEPERAHVEALAHAIGLAFWVDDDDAVDAVTAIAGSGPAYFYLLMEQMAAAGEAFGLPADATRAMVTETAAAAAALAAGSDAPLATLRANVTSPGGTTAAALDALAANDVAGQFRAAFQRARDRAGELADAAGDH